MGRTWMSEEEVRRSGILQQVEERKISLVIRRAIEEKLPAD